MPAPSLTQTDPMPRGRVIAILAEAIEVDGLSAPTGITWQGFPGDGHAGKAGNHIMYLTFAHAGAVTRWAEWLGAKTEHRVMSDGTSITDADLKWHGWSLRLVTYTDTLCDWSTGCDNAPSGKGWFPGVCTQHAATVRAAFVSAVPTDPGRTHDCGGPDCAYEGEVYDAARRVMGLSTADDLAAMPTGDVANRATAAANRAAVPPPVLTPGDDRARADAKKLMAATFVEPAVSDEDLRDAHAPTDVALVHEVTLDRGLRSQIVYADGVRDGHVRLGPDPSLFAPETLAEADAWGTVTPAPAVIAADHQDALFDDRHRICCGGDPVLTMDHCRQWAGYLDRVRTSILARYGPPTPERIDTDHRTALYDNAEHDRNRADWLAGVTYPTAAANECPHCGDPLPSAGHIRNCHAGQVLAEVAEMDRPLFDPAQAAALPVVVFDLGRDGAR